MRIKTAIIGLGPHGKRLVECILKNGQTELTAVVDKDRDKLRDAVLPDLTHKFDDLALLWELQIDMLLISTNGPSHAPIALEALNHGVKYLMVSKPVATTLADAKAIQNAGKERNARIVVDHGLRYDKTYRWIIESGDRLNFGNLRTIYVQRPGIGLGCLGVHSFDLCNAIARSEPFAVSGWVDNPVGKNPRGENFIDPGGLVILNYKNGVKAIISQIEDGCGPMSVEINYNRARIRVDEKSGTLEYVRKLAPGKFERIINPHDQQVSHNTIELMTAVINDLISTNPLNADLKCGVLSFEILLAAYVSNDAGHAPVALPIIDRHAEQRILPVT